MQVDERPSWARRIRAERAARSMSQADAVRALRAHSDVELPGDTSLLRNWKRWEAGEAEPDEFYKRLISKTFGTVTASLFPTATRTSADIEVISGTGITTLELLSRIRASDVSQATLDAIRITADRLCCEYPFMPSKQLQVEGRAWLGRITRLLDSRMTLTQHREILSLAGTVALLVGCVEYDMGMRNEAEVTRKGALSLGEEAENPDVVGWAQEMRAWYSLTQGDYKSAIAAGRAGEEAAPGHSVAVQLAAQQAKAWARIGDRRQMEIALDRGRNLLDTLPIPEDTDHHFVVDPDKFDFYAMDCYRIVGENRLAELYATEVIRTSTDINGAPRKPMRAAEATITQGVIAARVGEIELAVSKGEEALDGERKSVPSLLMCSKELSAILAVKHPDDPNVTGYLERIRALSR